MRGPAGKGEQNHGAALTADRSWFTVTVNMAKKSQKRSKEPVRVLWDNPPGAGQGITIERTIAGHVFSRRVGPRGLLTPTETAQALHVSRVYVYRLVWDGKLKSVKKEGRLAIPLKSVKEFEAARRKKKLRKGEKEVWLTNG